MDKCDVNADNAFGPSVRPGCRDGFDFTLLFEQSVLSTIPSLVTIIFSLVHSFYLSRQNVKVERGGYWWLRAVKLVFILCYVAVQLALVVLWASPTNNPTKFSVPASALSMVTGLALMVLSYLAHNRSSRPSEILNIYPLFSILFDIPQARTLWFRETNGTVANVFTAGIALKVFVLFFEMIEKRRILKAPYSQYPPEALGGVINRSVFWWINALLIKGSSTKLHQDDLFNLDKKLTSEYIEPKFRRAWEASVTTSPHALLWAALKCFWVEMVTIFVFRLCYIAFEFCQPLLIHKALSLLLSPSSQRKTNTGRALIGATALIYLGLALTTALYRHHVYRLITMIRSGIISLIYDATLTLDNTAASDSAALTLMNTDVDRIASGLEVFDYLWAGPIEIAIAMYLLYHQIGISFLAPVLLSIALVSLSMAMRGITSKAQKVWMAAIERRVATTATALSNMKGIKMTGLSDSIGEELQDLRIAELRVSTRYRYILSICTAISTVSKVAIPVLTLITYAVVIRARDKAYLNPVVAFTLLSLVALLATPIQNIAKSVPEIASAAGCFQRVQKYIGSNALSRDTSNLEGGAISTHENFEDEQKLHDATDMRDSMEKRAMVVVKDADFSLSSMTDPILRGISMSLVEGTWTVLTGPIGCGKTMLILALLKELHLCKGSSYLKPSRGIGYCSQNPWLPNLSVRQLITAQTELDEKWYSTILDACVLRPDLDNLPAGDQTFVGSNGISLSGGQKQRICLARALYSRKTLLVLDDVLGGLDSKTEQAIVENVFVSKGLLRELGVTVLLATHSVRQARQADHVIVMGNGGVILEQGPPTQIALFKGFDWDLKISEDTDSFTSSEEIAATFSKLQKRGDDQLENQNIKSARPRLNGDIRLYTYYLQAIGWSNAIWQAIAVCGFAVFLKFPTLWAGWWANAEEAHPGVHTNMYAGLYGLFCGICVLFFSVAIMLLFQVGLPRSSIRLHAKLLKSVVQAPYWFLVSTDSGQILNRFGQDMSLLCDQLPVAFSDTLFNIGVCLVGLVIISLASKWFALIYPALFVILYILQNFYLRTSRQIRLFDLEAKSPLYSNFLQTLQGLVTIRAFDWQDSLTRENAALLDKSQIPYYLMYSIQRWLNVVLDLIVAAIATLIMALAMLLGGASAGALGVALVNLLNFSQDLNFLIRTWTELETSLGAISRIKTFEVDTPNENLPEENVEPPAGWPFKGHIELRGLSCSYKADADNVLKDISLEIHPGSKVGICGRTGSGKSTLLLTLLRLAEINRGDVLIDNVSIKTTSRNTLRRHILAMPQDPLLLMGTVRFNADPFSEHPDNLILSALKEVGISNVVSAHGGLDAPMKTMSLSRGQQQLFCLTRAILSTSYILLLDEMTSNVDAATEARMMEVVNRSFAKRTIVAVAHRLHTIRDFDTIVVLDQGRIVETGSPDELLGRPSIFRELWGSQQ